MTNTNIPFTPKPLTHPKAQEQKMNQITERSTSTELGAIIDVMSHLSPLSDHFVNITIRTEETGLYSVTLRHDVNPLNTEQNGEHLIAQKSMDISDIGAFLAAHGLPLHSELLSGLQNKERHLGQDWDNVPSHGTHYWDNPSPLPKREHYPQLLKSTKYNYNRDFSPPNESEITALKALASGKALFPYPLRWFPDDDCGFYEVIGVGAFIQLHPSSVEMLQAGGYLDVDNESVSYDISLKGLAYLQELSQQTVEAPELT